MARVFHTEYPLAVLVHIRCSNERQRNHLYGFIRSTRYPRANRRAGRRIFRGGIWRLSMYHHIGNLPM